MSRFSCLFIVPYAAATVQHFSMNALARYHVILLGEQRHIRCKQLAWRMPNVDDLLWDNRSRERLNGFPWNFHQTIGGGNYSLKRRAAACGSRAAAWRMANIDALRNLRYDSFAVTRGRHVIYAMTLAELPEGATGGCVIQQWAGELM